MSRRWSLNAKPTTDTANAHPYGLNPFGHQGLPHDPVTNLVYNRARMLHPRLGRFMQRDPLGYVDGPNRYQMLRSNPVNLIDPWGLQSDAPSIDDIFGDLQGGITGDVWGDPSITKAVDFGDDCEFLLFINGIKNTNEDAENSYDDLRDNLTFPKQQSARVQNGTHYSDLGDWAQVGFNEIGTVLPVRTLAGRRTVRQIRQMAEAAKDNGCCCYTIHVVAHSQGTAVFDEAIKTLSPKIKKRIDYQGAGPQSLIGNDRGLGRSKNWLKHGDPVPIPGNLIEMLPFFNDRFNTERFGDPDAPLDSKWHPFRDNYVSKFTPSSLESTCDD
jgi:RHS repeat-associated protein